MAWTQVDRDTLAAMIMRGVLTVEYDGRRVTYHSLADMRSLLAEMDAQLASASIGGNARVSTVFSTFTRE